ncbi:MAG: RNA polymerase sigma-54 factor, partial [Brevundimonas sp.]|nr:RNA polymerase sigma-54 factor [Brevundimonas sp.]
MIGQRLEIRQGQGLVITPQLQQAIKLLQLSNQELDEYVEAELEKNPLLQREEAEAVAEPTRELTADSAELSFSDAEAADRAVTVDAREDDVYGDATPGERTSDRLSDEAASQPGLSDWSAAGKGGSFNDGDGGERPERHDPTLWEHLQAQASSAGLSPADHAIALALIDGVDEGGYLRGELEELADRLGCGMDRIEAVLAVCQAFEPTGVMARSVPECL